MATLSDIAKIAGVNKTTVSKALRESGDINKNTARRIRDIAVKLNYPLPKRNIDPVQVAIFCPEVTSHYYSTMVTTLFETLSADDYHPFILLTDFDGEREGMYFRRMAELPLAGIVCITEEPDIRTIVRGPIAAANAPIVVMGLNYQAADHDVLSVDERIGVRAAVCHLKELNHERIAFIGDKYGGQRLNYMIEALGQTLPPEYMAISDLRNEACGYEQMNRLLSLPNPPTAIFAEYDLVALGVYRAVSERGLSIPGDVSVIGFDDADFCRYLPVALTSINSNVKDMCHIASAILTKKIRDPQYHIIQTVAVKPELMVRESTGPARL